MCSSDLLCHTFLFRLVGGGTPYLGMLWFRNFCDVSVTFVPVCFKEATRNESSTYTSRKDARMVSTGNKESSLL